MFNIIKFFLPTLSFSLSIYSAKTDYVLGTFFFLIFTLFLIIPKVWKGNVKKRGLLLLIIIILSFFVFDQMKYTTFGNVMSSLENETVYGVNIIQTSTFKSFGIRDKEEIEQIIDQSSDMEIKRKQDKYFTEDYKIIIYTEQYKSYYIYLNKNLIEIRSNQQNLGNYQIIGDNNLYSIIESTSNNSD